MAENLTIEGFDFDRIERDAGREARDAIYGIWVVLNRERRDRRQGLTLATARTAWGIQYHSPGAARHNLAHSDVSWQQFDGATAVDVTGWRAGVEGQLLVVAVLGSATITLKHNHGSSDTIHRMLFAGAADKAVATNRAVALAYLNQRWREVLWA